MPTPPRMIPALADLTQDIAGPLPVKLLHDWAQSPQDGTAAESLLEPFRVEGIAVSTDTVGLTKLSNEMDLVRALSIISRPKKIIHALGVEIGGRAIGRWVADNSQMFYPRTASADDVTQSMWEVQRRVKARNLVEIGMCIHDGGFYEIGGGLYGPDADMVEHLAEEYSRGGEILITPQLRGSLSAKYSLVERPDLDTILPGMQALSEGPGRPDLPERNRDYPHPYTDEFMGKLNELETAPDPDGLIRDIYGNYLQAAAVVFIVQQRPEIESRLASMLDGFLNNAVLDTVLRDANAGNHLVKSVRGLAILTFIDVGEAVDFARDVRDRFARNGLSVSIGIDYGALLVFNETGGYRDLAGDPVNVASKLSEDFGKPGCVHFTSRVMELLPHKLSDAQPFTLEISKVAISGYLV